MDNPSLARALAEVADLLQIEGANPFRIRAYRNAVRTLEVQTTPIARWVEEGRDLTALPGIGKEMARHLEELVATGSLAFRDELAARVPPGLVDLMRLSGVGPKRARTLWQELGVESPDALEQAARAGRVRGLAGFGARTEEKILAGIAEWRRTSARMRVDQAERHVEALLGYLREAAPERPGGGKAKPARGRRKAPAAPRLEVAGSYRRRCETVGDLDVLAEAADDAAARRLVERFTAYPQVAEVAMAGPTRASVVLGSGIRVDLRVVPPESWGAALVYFTGSKEHNVRLRQRAIERGLRISEYGVFEAGEGTSEIDGGAEAAADAGAAGAGVGETGGPEAPSAASAAAPAGRRVAGAEEADVYAAVGCAWVPPELREDRGELAAAARGELPELVTVDDLRGDLQMHSTWSDGRASIEEMAAACAARGYEYFALTDHSQALPMIGGLDAAAVRRQWEEIAEVQARHPEIEILRSLEIDILADGTLDLDEETLAGLDLVVVSIHSRFGLPADEQTERILRAVSHPEVDVLAHPLGRRLGKRRPMEFDLDAVLAACAEHGVAVEANASPERLDLPGPALARARELGVAVVISTDAHSPRALAGIRHGVDQARRGGLEPRHVLNALPLGELLDRLAKRNPAAPPAVP